MKKEDILTVLNSYGKTEVHEIKGKDKKIVYYCFVQKAERPGLIRELVSSFKFVHKTNGTGYLKCSVGYLQINNNEFIVFKAEKSGGKNLPANSLKPDKLKLIGSWTINQLPTKIKSGLNDDAKNLGHSGIYCSLMTDYIISAGTKNKNEMINYFKENKLQIDLNSIKKDFGECIGPLAIYYFKLLNNKDILDSPLNPSTIVEFPARSNEPLLDYLIKNGAQEIKVSAKADMGKTNTVKPGDIIANIDENEVKKLKYGEIKLEIMKCIDENTTWMGSVAVAIPLKKLGIPEFKDFKDEWFEPKKKKDDLIPPDALVWAKTVQPKLVSDWNDKVTYTGLGQIIGIYLEEITKNGILDYRDIILMALNSQLIYCMFNIDSKGIPIFEIKTGKDLFDTSKRPYLRNKNYQVKNSIQVRAADKIGFQM